jgi:hypothetical protein
MLVDFDADPTENMDDASDELMSNFDHEVNKDIEKELIENNNLKASYPGWEFHGICWYKDNNFYCRVMRYHSIVGYYKADTPEELMEEISGIYGYN